MKKKLFLLAVLSVHFLFSQEKKKDVMYCGTELLAENKKIPFKKRTYSKIQITPVSIPLKIHIVRNSDGTGGLSQLDLDTAINDLNTKFAPMQMSFYICNGVNYINDTTFYSFNSPQENDLAEPTELLQTINVYFVNYLELNGSNSCGYAKYPNPNYGSNQRQETNRILMQNSCATNGSTLAHEIGHFFSVRHTHNAGNELVNGSNCTTAGDGFCDTPADPNIYKLVDGTTCIYTGTATDANGDFYMPLTNNIMSYSEKVCRTSFTNEQGNAMLQSLANERNYLACNNNYSISYTCNDQFEPSNIHSQATTYSGVTGFEEFHCLSENDVDWIAKIEVNTKDYYIKVTGANTNTVGAYKVIATINNEILTIETSPSIMLNTDTKLFLYANDSTTLLAQDDNGGEDNFSKIVFNTNTLKVESDELNQITIYPNPTNNFVTIKNNLNTTFSELKIVTVLGKTLMQKIATKNTTILDFSNYPKGLYFLKIKTDTKVISKKIVKR